MLHWWLLPMMAILLLAVVGLFLAILRTGGSGVRTEGRIMHDKPVEEDDSRLS